MIMTPQDNNKLLAKQKKIWRRPRRKRLGLIETFLMWRRGIRDGKRGLPMRQEDGTWDSPNLQKEIHSNIISGTAYSKFIKGLANIRLDTMNQLLKQANISWNEFMINCDEYCLDNLDSLDRIINQHLSANNIHKLRSLSDTFLIHYKKSNLEYHYHIHLLLKFLVHSRWKISPLLLENEVSTIVRYLHRVESFTRYEQYLFSSFLFILSPQDVKLFQGKLFKQLQEDTIHYKNTHCFADMNNIISYYIKHKMLNEASSLCDNIRQVCTHYFTHPSFLFDRILFDFLSGIIMIRQNNQEGIKLCQQSLHILNIFEEFAPSVNQLSKQLEMAIRGSGLNTHNN